MTDETLKPCPFCGGEVELEEVIDDYANHVTKAYCCVEVEVLHDEHDMKKAIKAWNTRHTPEPTEAEIERAAEAINEYLGAVSSIPSRIYRNLAKTALKAARNIPTVKEEG